MQEKPKPVSTTCFGISKYQTSNVLDQYVPVFCGMRGLATSRIEILFEIFFLHVGNLKVCQIGNLQIGSLRIHNLESDIFLNTESAWELIILMLRNN